MGDFDVEIGFNTNELKRAAQEAAKAATAGAAASAGGAGGKGMSNAVAGGLKIAGVVALLSSLKLVTDFISGIMATIGLIIVGIGKGISFLVGSFIRWIIPFFKDPVGALLSVAIFIVNGIIGAIESLINFIKPGKDIELGRFREDILFNSRELASQLEGVEKDSKEYFKIINSFNKTVGNSFLTEEEYARANFEQLLKTQGLTEEAYNAQDDLARVISSRSTESAKLWDKAFNNLNKVFKGTARGTGGALFSQDPSRRTPSQGLTDMFSGQGQSIAERYGSGLNR